MDLREMVVVLLVSAGYIASLLYFLVNQINLVVFWLRSVEVPGRAVRTYERYIGSDEYREHIVTMSEVEFETGDGSTRRVTGEGNSYTVRYDPRTGNSMLADDLRSVLVTGSIIVAVFLILGAVMGFAIARYALA